MGNFFDQFDEPPFDPDAYLAGKPAPAAFDPDAYLAGKPGPWTPFQQGRAHADPKAWGAIPVEKPDGEAPGIVGGTAQSFVEGVPILGPALRNANAALSATVAPYIPSESDQLPGQTFGERYGQARARQDAQAQAFREAHPILAPGAEIAGGIASMVPAAGTTLGARLLGLVGESLPTLALKGAASGAAINAADALVRGESPGAAAGMGAATGFAGPVLGRIAGGVANKFVPSVATPEAGKILGATDKAYDALTAAANGIPVPPQATKSLAARMTEKLTVSGQRRSVAPQVHDAIGELANPAVGDLTDLVGARRTLKIIAGGADATEADAARKVMPILDTQIIKAAPDLYSTLKQADKDWALGRTAQMVDQAIEAAKLRTPTGGLGGNLGNAVRQEFFKIIKNKSGRLSPEELAQATRVAKGDILTNVARIAGALDPTAGRLSFILHAIAAIPTGGMSLAAAAVPGFVARKIADARTLGNAQQLSEMIRARSSLATQNELFRAGRDALIRSAMRRGALASRALPAPLVAGQPMGILGQ